MDGDTSTPGPVGRPADLAAQTAEHDPPDGLRGRLTGRDFLSEQDRAQTLDALMVGPSLSSVRRYAVLLTLSVVVAAVGLLQDSDAVVIGAMMIAPLMAPIMGVAASLVLGWGRRLLIGILVVVASIGAAVGIAWFIARFLPDASTKLPSAILARTSPDVRDLLIALAAGTAGSYATVRRDISGALPGVAVAVALVPPLACVGVLIGHGQPDLAGGAGLLFATNLLGIILAAAVVFVLTGLVPADHLHARRVRVLATLGLAAIPTLAIAAILTSRFLGTVEHARELKLATQATVAWLDDGNELNRVSMTGSTVQINVTGKKAPPPLRPLTADLSTRLGHPTSVDLRWTPVHDDTPPPPAPPLDRLEPPIRHWLSEQSLSLDGLTHSSTSLIVATSGDHPPHDADQLTALIRSSFPTTPPISLSWTHSEPAPTADTTTARSTTEAWTAAHPGTAVLAVDQAATTAVVTLTGPDRPATDDLEAALRAALPTMTITIQWIPGNVLSQYTPPTTSPTPAAPVSAAPEPTTEPTGPR